MLRLLRLGNRYDKGEGMGGGGDGGVEVGGKGCVEVGGRGGIMRNI